MLTDRVRAWESGGERIDFRGHSIFVRRGAGAGPPLLLLHGFPSSSYDFRALLEQLPGRATIAFDMLGFGLSDKPRGFDYSLTWQADLAEELAPDEPVLVVGHDIGTSVATELMARSIRGELRMRMAGVLLLNGSMLQDVASPMLGQRILASPLGPAFARDDRARMDERRRLAERWHGAFRDWPGDLSLVWGVRDPVATPAVLAELRNLRSAVPVRELRDAGHYPQIELPSAVARAVEEALRRTA